MGSHLADQKQAEKSERVAGIVMSVLAAIGFGAGGVYALWQHTLTLPGRSGNLVTSSGTNAELVGWVLLAGAAAFLSHLAMLLKPGKPGVKWMAGIFAVWAAAAALYYAVR